MKKPVLFLDMDDTLADFGSGCPEDQKTEYAPEAMYEDGFFANLKPMEGAIGAVRKLWDSELFDIYICSVPVAGLHQSYSDKSKWIGKYFPYLYDRIILTQDKHLLNYDFIIDDNAHWRDGAKRGSWDAKSKRKGNQRFKWHELAERIINTIEVTDDVKRRK